MSMAGFIVFVIGLIFVISYPMNKGKNKRCTEETQGQLVDIRRRYNSRGSRKSLHVYSYIVNGTEYLLRTAEHSPVAKNIGESCPIWYNPKKPQDAEAYRASDDYLKKLLIIGIVLVVVGIIMIFAGLIMSVSQ